MMEKRQANTGFPETAARGEAVPQERRAPARLPLTIGQAYERFLELPPAFVLAVMWVAGAALLGSIALVLYSVGWVLIQAVVVFI
jgi:hypothetical protein